MTKTKKEPAVGTSHNRRAFRQQSHWVDISLKGDIAKMECGLIPAASASIMFSNSNWPKLLLGKKKVLRGEKSAGHEERQVGKADSLGF